MDVDADRWRVTGLSVDTFRSMKHMRVEMEISRCRRFPDYSLGRWYAIDYMLWIVLRDDRNECSVWGDFDEAINFYNGFVVSLRKDTKG